MTLPARFQLLTCLLVYASSAHAIMVKFGTKDGPIEPPAPTPELPPAQPYRAPAPVWEPRSNDTPDPNAQWRPQLFLPQPRYTQVVYNPQPTPSAQNVNTAQQFVNAYLPQKPIQAQPVSNYFTPSQILSSQSLPGFGLRYFVPTYVNDLQLRKEQKRQEDAKHNDIETNEVHDEGKDSAHDAQWKYEKDSSRRNVRTTPEGTATAFVYQWPAFVSSRHR